MRQGALESSQTVLVKEAQQRASSPGAVRGRGPRSFGRAARRRKGVDRG